MISILKDGKDINIIYLEHMLSYKNLENVLKNGLLSHNQAYSKGLIKQDISMAEVQNIRRQKVPSGANFTNSKLTLHDFVSFYFNSKNPMLYVRKNEQEELLILLISADILDCSQSYTPYAIFSDGNAANKPTKFFLGKQHLKDVDLDLLQAGSWNDADENLKKEKKRKMCAEVLIYPTLPVSKIVKIICPNNTMYNHVSSLKSNLGASVSHIEVEINNQYFF